MDGLNFDDLVGYPLPNGSGGLDYIQTPAHRQDVALPPRSAEQTGVNLKRAKEIMTTKLIISGGKLAEPSAPFLLYAEEFLDEQFGLGRSASPALHLELGWIEEQGKGDHATNKLLGMEFDPAFVRPLKLFEQLGLRAIELGLGRVEGDIPGYPFDHVAYSGTAERLQEMLLEVGFNV